MLDVIPTEVYVFIDEQRETYRAAFLEMHGQELPEVAYEGEYLIDVEEHAQEYSTRFFDGIDLYEGLHITYTLPQEEQKIRALLANGYYDCCLRASYKEALLVLRPRLHQYLLTELLTQGSVTLTPTSPSTAL